jgi:hypothetical protein
MKSLLNYKLQIALLLCWVHISCNQEELKAPIPAYLFIPEIQVEITDPKQGTGSSNITDCWVIVDNDLVGIFEIPATIPIQQTGEVAIRLRPAIRINGLSNNKEIYPFYTDYQINTNLPPLEEETLHPVVNYVATATINEPSPGYPGEDFEFGNSFKYPYTSGPMFSPIDGPDAFEGSSGQVTMGVGTDLFEAFTPTFYDVPRNGEAIYLEFNYQSTHDFSVGIFRDDQRERIPIVNVRARSYWNKIYIDLGEPISSNFNAFNYSIYFRLEKTAEETAVFRLDNVKLIHA